MKRIVFTLIFAVLGVSAWGQVKYPDLVKNAIKVEDVGYSDELWFSVPGMKNFNDYWGNAPKSNRDQFAYLLNKDVVYYNHLWKEFNTELKRKAFTSSAKGQELFSELNTTYNAVINKDYYYLYDLKNSYRSKYNVQAQRFDIENTITSLHHSSLIKGYINFRLLCLSTTQSLVLRSVQTVGYGSEPSIRQDFSVPLQNESMALEIENNIADCAVLIIFNIQRSEKLQTAFMADNFIFGKTKSVYIVNKKTGKIYSDTPVSIPQSALDASMSNYPLDKNAHYTQDETLNTFINNLKEVVTLKDTVKIRAFLGGRPLEMFDSKPTYYDWADEYYGSELHKQNTAAWDSILKAIESGGAKENSDRGLYIFPWYEVGFDKYIGTWNDRTERFDNQLVDMFSACAVIGDNINVRSAPNTNASIVAKLSWQVVARDTEYYESVIGETDWVKISTLDNMIHGFVSSKLLFAPWGTRVIIEKLNGHWKIVGFRTCD